MQPGAFYDDTPGYSIPGGYYRLLRGAVCYMRDDLLLRFCQRRRGNGAALCRLNDARHLSSDKADECHSIPLPHQRWLWRWDPDRSGACVDRHRSVLPYAHRSCCPRRV